MPVCTQSTVTNVPVLRCVTLRSTSIQLSAYVHYMVNIQLSHSDRYYNSSTLGYSVLPTGELLSVMSGITIVEIHCTDQRHFCLVTLRQNTQYFVPVLRDNILSLFYFELLDHQEKWGIISGQPHIFKFLKILKSFRKVFLKHYKETSFDN